MPLARSTTRPAGCVNPQCRRHRRHPDTSFGRLTVRDRPCLYGGERFFSPPLLGDRDYPTPRGAVRCRRASPAAGYAVLGILPIYMFFLSLPGNLIIGGLEEAGWMYILQPELDKKYGFVLSSVFVGIIWVLWHIPLFFIPGTNHGEGLINFFDVCSSSHCISIFLRGNLQNIRKRPCVYVRIIPHHVQCGIPHLWRPDYDLCGNHCRKYCDCSYFNCNRCDIQKEQTDSISIFCTALYYEHSTHMKNLYSLFRSQWRA